MTSSNDDPTDNTRSHIQLQKDIQIGHYRIIEKIDAGGMGEVYLAKETMPYRKDHDDIRPGRKQARYGGEIWDQWTEGLKSIQIRSIQQFRALGRSIGL